MRSPEIQKWWPATQSLDLVQAPCTAVAKAIESRVHRFIKSDTRPFQSSWHQLASIDECFGLVAEFTNVPTIFLVIPTVSEWSILWNNSFLCNGYCTMCANLTKHDGFTTMHWHAHDQTTTFQTGAAFTWRQRIGTQVSARSVSVIKDDRNWHYSESGEALPEEDISLYSARLKKNRLNETIMHNLLARLNARPWDTSFYDFTQDVFMLNRVGYPDTITKRKPDIVITG